MAMTMTHASGVAVEGIRPRSSVTKTEHRNRKRGTKIGVENILI